MKKNMLTNDFITAWNDSRTVTMQIAEAMNTEHFNIDFKAHPDMNSFGDIASHLIAVVYHNFKNYLKITEVEIPKYLKKPINYEIFKSELIKTNTMVLDLMKNLSMDDLQQEAYFWEPTKTSYSKGWVVFNIITHERWTQAQLKMYLKLMGVDTSKIGH